MSDMTSDMIDTGADNAPQAPSRKAVKAEFMVYFAIIFVATLPLATLTWALQAIRTRSFTDKGPMARAWTQARIITPMIFSAY
ncbi:cytochrome PufQ [uncultured Roseobacter sp.]|uniref:cytochrome PufQ n=1 Tax=uncultured Roseobacter sp. TaxID=114847 RepID=UPI00261FEF36|nr:cytochrome PufQ [uncultured Roseobacter sp.]